MRSDVLTALNICQLGCDVVCSGYRDTDISEEIPASIIVDF
jgi:hypothetical protein